MVSFLLPALLLVSSVFAFPAGSDSPSSSTTPSKWVPGPTFGSDALAVKGLLKLKVHKAKQVNQKCTLDKAYRRKEWDTFTPDQKRGYIKAVKCMYTKPSISGDLVPGARNRVDDFVGTHINQTLSIHSTGNFLSWHRYFTWTWETALRDECGYTGYQPYANWGRYTNSVIGSPLFDGSDTSISGNGVFEAHPPIVFGPPVPGALELNPGPGGGCINSGPFKDVAVNLGPVPGGLAGSNNSAPNPRPDGFGYNPRCIKRDLSVQSVSGASDANTTKLITNNDNIAGFQDEMQTPFLVGRNEYGVHAAGHYTVGGDPGGDFFVSPGEPWFWLHHAQVGKSSILTWEMRSRPILTVYRSRLVDMAKHGHQDEDQLHCWHHYLLEPAAEPQRHVGRHYRSGCQCKRD
jgi:tyrosinase